MISKTYIQKNITQINKLYQSNPGAMEGLYFAKLAILEVCGWIEESMDSIVLSYANRYLTDSRNIDYTRDAIVGMTYGFDYDKDFRWMLMRVMGIIFLERFEMSLDPTKFNKMKSSLTYLKYWRNKQAHTHIKGTTIHIDAPSVTERHFRNVYNGLKHIESLIIKVKI